MIRLIQPRKSQPLTAQGSCTLPSVVLPHRETVARAHGYPDWDALAARSVAGGGSLDDRQWAAHLLALARRNLAREPVDGIEA